MYVTPSGGVCNPTPSFYLAQTWAIDREESLWAPAVAAEALEWCYGKAHLTNPRQGLVRDSSHPRERKRWWIPITSNYSRNLIFRRTSKFRFCASEAVKMEPCMQAFRLPRVGLAAARPTLSFLLTQHSCDSRFRLLGGVSD